ncbi:MAG: N-formylglutamate amidohydrolase [Bdellovibrionales bacterium]|nr:N-formylglutamate amidohydrolase [Bdellovibrionales bacterium]
MKPFFISIPHSGERVPSEAHWLQGLPEPILMCDIDRYVDRLYGPVVDQLRLACVKTQWHRYVVDLNRLPEDVDAESVQGSENPAGKFTTGLHWVKTTRGTRLMPKPISQALHQQLVERYFNPFHDDVRDTYGFFNERGAKKVYHLDAHSMPSKGTSAHRDPGETRADIVVSDQEGKSCETAFKDLVIEAYSKTGLKVAYNWPYLGGRVTQTYGQPQNGQHAIQVEINRALYMDEESKQLLPEKAQALSAKLAEAVRMIYERTPDL